jgi:hypothetical protein
MPTDRCRITYGEIQIHVEVVPIHLSLGRTHGYPTNLRQILHQGAQDSDKTWHPQLLLVKLQPNEL